MIRTHSISVIAAAVFAAFSTAAVAQSTADQRTGASQSSQTNPYQSVNPSAATGVDAGVGFRGDHNAVFMNSEATTNQSTSASQNTGSTQGMNVQPSQGTGGTSGSGGSGDHSAGQRTGASQAAQTNPEQSVNPSAATGVQSDARFQGDHNAVFMDSRATTNQSTTASQNTGSTQGMAVSPSQNRAASGVPGMSAVPGAAGSVPGISSNVKGGAAASAGGTSSAAGGEVGAGVDFADRSGERKAWGRDKAPGQQKKKHR